MKEDQIPISFLSGSIFFAILIVGLAANIGVVLLLFEGILYFSPGSRPGSGESRKRNGSEKKVSGLFRNSKISESIVFHSFFDYGKKTGLDLDGLQKRESIGKK